MVAAVHHHCGNLSRKKKSRGKKEKPLPLIRHPGVGMVVCHLVSVYTCSSLIIKTQLVEKKKSIKKKNIP